MADADFNIHSQGERIEDVITSFMTCREAFAQLEILLRNIGKGLPPETETKRLTDLAHYIAYDYEELADCFMENLERNGVSGFLGSDFDNLVTVSSKKD